LRPLLICLLGGLWWWGLPLRRRLAVEQLRRCFPAEDPRGLRLMMGEVALSYLELLVGILGEVEGAEHARGGALALAGHFPGWDLALVSGGAVAPVTIYVREPRSRLAAGLVRWLRGRSDVQLLGPGSRLEAGRRALEAGRVVVMVQDQRHNAGLEVPFFGQPARTSAGFAAIYLSHRPPVVGIAHRRGPDGRLRVKVEPLAVPEGLGLEEITAWTQSWMEAQIRSQPAAWWWLHERWKRVGPAGDLRP
jgi:KDO2-lipid IV(A) lauroyltransferase